MEQTQYFFDNEEKSYSGVLDCGNCSRYGRVPPFFCMSQCLFNRDRSDVVRLLLFSDDSQSDAGYLDLSAATVVATVEAGTKALLSVSFPSLVCSLAALQTR